jgi:serine protease Do
MLGDAFGEVAERLRRVTVQVFSGGNSRGSGVVWNAAGLVLTNAHVLAERGLQVALWNGRRLDASVRKKDRRRDLASLQIDIGQIDADGLSSAIPGDSDALRPGELVIAVGSPFGFVGAVSTGVIHSVGPLAGTAQAWVVSDVRLAPGNSGGPLANAQGQVIGLNTLIAGGLALAIPSRSVEQFLERSAAGDVYLGVTARPVPLERSVGFLVLEIAPQSPAERASLLPGDLLIGAAQRLFRSADDLEDALHSSRDGKLEIEFRRGASRHSRKVVARLTAEGAWAA